ncbi:MAG: sugar phosphate isomerase/epimerase family protein [Saprospiraceae bacterium]
MKLQTRRAFLETSAGLMALAALNPLFKENKKTEKLAFSTLGCPDWRLKQIVDCSVENGYKGFEIRGLAGEMDLPKCPEFNKTNLPASLRLIKDNDIKIINLGSSVNLHFAQEDKRKSNLDDAKRFIDLAEQLECPFVRVFPDDLPPDQSVEQTLDLIISGLVTLGEYAKGSNVSILLESHGKVVYKDMLLKIMAGANHPKVGLIWDFFNMWVVTKESPMEVFDTLGKYIKHVHIKDANLVDGKPAYCLIGQGVAPLREAMDSLKRANYKGYYSFEWEKKWHPEIQDPEIAFPHFAKEIIHYL